MLETENNENNKINVLSKMLETENNVIIYLLIILTSIGIILTNLSWLNILFQLAYINLI